MDYRKQKMKPLPFLRVVDVEPRPNEQTWLIENLWLTNGVGILGGQAKVCKTYLAAELSVAIATGMPALGHYQTHFSGSVLFYGAEDSLPALRERFEGLAVTYGFDLQKLDVYLIDSPVLRLDKDEDLQRLRAVIDKCQPRMLVLDPFVRLVGKIDENSSSDVSAVLGSLRAIQRDHNVAVMLVHHARKSPAAHPFQAYRGSSDFGAWSDSNLFLARNSEQLVLSVEHRSAPSPEPITLKFEIEPAPHLTPINASHTKPSRPDPLGNQINQILEDTGRALATVELRERVRRRKIDVVKALEQLRKDDVIIRTSNGWLPKHR